MHIQHLTPVPTRRATHHWPLFAWVLLLLTGGAHASYGQEFQGPLVITSGGTYTGNYESNDSNVPAISINTDQPVIIQNAIIRSRGTLIRAGHPNNNVTVRNSRGYGLTPDRDNVKYGRFIDATTFKNIVLEHNYMEQTSGIYLAGYQGNQSTGETVKILYNEVKNIDGRTRNGGKEWSQFVQFNSVRRVRGAEIAWNQIINEPYKSRVEENINFYQSNGTSDSPIRVHDNYIQGAYPASPGTETEYGGGGINMGDGATGDMAASSGFIHAYNNQIVSTGTQGICVSAGHDMEIYNNRVVSSGYLEDGTYIASQNVGIYIAKLGYGYSTFFNNKAYNNTIGYVNRKPAFGTRARNDSWLPDAFEPNRYDLNEALPNPITRDTEKGEFVIWQSKLRSNGVVVGPVTGTTSIPAPAPAPTPSPAPSNQNYVLNGSFEADNRETQTPSNWLTWSNDNASADASYVESFGGTQSGNYHATHARNHGDYEVYTYQVVRNLPNGVYRMRAWVKNAGGQSGTFMIAKKFGGSERAIVLPRTGGSGQYSMIEIRDINVTNGQCEVAFYSKTAPGQSNWSQFIYFDDVELVPQSGTASVTTSQSTLSATASSSAKAASSSDLAVYPNPASEYVMLPAGTDYVQIVNQGGTTVMEKRGALAQRLDVNTLSSGLYQVRMGGNGKLSSQRLQVQ